MKTLFRCSLLALLIAGLIWTFRSRDESSTGVAPIENVRGNSPISVSVSAPAEVVGSGWESETLPAMADFAGWCSKYEAAADSERTTLVAEGVRLARERRGELAKWIRADPERALAAAVPEMQRRRLPPEIVAQLEERISGQGELARVAALPEPGEKLAAPVFHKVLVGGREFFGFPYGRRAILNTLPQASLFGIALDGAMAVSDSPMRVLETGETANGRQASDDAGLAIGPDVPLNADASAPPTAFEVNGNIVVFKDPARAAALEKELIADEGHDHDHDHGDAADNLPGTSGVAGRPAQAWTHGTKKLLVIRIDFSDLTGTPTNFFDGNAPITEDYSVNRINSAGGVKDFFEEGSFGKTSIQIAPTVGGDSPDVTGVLRMPQTASYYATNNFTSTMHSDARAAAALAGFTVDDYDRICVVFSRLTALPGSKITFGGLGNIEGKNFWINSSYSFRTVAHELGHNYGLYHANHWTVTDGNPVSPTGTSDEYGDIFDLMGDGNTKEYHFSHWNKSLLQWIPDDSVTTITTGGTYRVHRFDHQAANLDNSLALKIVRTRDLDYWIGLRRATSNASMDGGAYVLWGYNSNRESELLDLTAPVNDLSSAALAVGATFVDSAVGITLKTLAQGGSGADEWLDVQVTLQPRLSWELAGFVADEQGGLATLTLIRESNSAGSVSVHYATSNGTATAPADYTASSGTVTWPDGDLTPQQITIPIVADASVEGLQEFTVTLDTPTGGAVIVDDPTAIVTIAEAGARDDTFAPNSVNSSVLKILPLPDGSALLGGFFSSIQEANFDSHARGGITRIKADGSLDPTFADEGGYGSFNGFRHVSDIARQPDGKLIVVGDFTTFNGAAHNNIVRLNTDGTVDSTFNPGAGANDTVKTVVIRPDGKILIGGRFTTFNGAAREYVAQLDENGGLDTSFIGPNFGNIATWNVGCLALQPDGKALVGGTFYFGSVTKFSLCRITTSGSLDATFNGVTFGAHAAGNTGDWKSVYDIKVEMSGTILIAGDFTAFNNVARGGFARLTSTGTLDPGINPTSDGACNTILTQPDGRILVGGDFTTFNGVTVNHLVRLSSAGVVETAFSAGGGSDGSIETFALQPDGKVLLAGSSSMKYQASANSRRYWRFFGGLPGLPGTMQIDTESVVGIEGTNASVSVSRTGGSSGTVSVGYSTVAGTAGAADFTATSGTLTWTDGDAAAKTISVPILSDGVAEGPESLFVQIGEPLRSSAILGEVQRATISVNTAFDAWRIGQFTTLELADSGISGDLADPDLDGSKNLLEFALNMPPKTASPSGLPTMGSTNVGGQDYLTITFLRRVPTLDLSYTVQASGTLDTPSWLANAVQVGSPVNHGNGTETVTFRDSTPISGATKRFLRLMVTRTP